MPDDEWDYRLGPQFLSLNEKVDGRLVLTGWETADFDDNDWPAAVFATPQRKMSPMLDPWRLVPRDIPFLPEIPVRFDGVVRASDPASVKGWSRLLSDGSSVVVPGNSSQWVEIEASALTTGFLDAVFATDGEDAQGETPPVVSILWSECYESPMQEGSQRTKGDRTDHTRGTLYGTADTYTLGPGVTTYSPFWFRAFRYVRLTIDASGCSTPVTVKSLTYRSTHYPLDIQTTIETSDPLLRRLWDISLNTLRNCMHETYEDCPFYEQNQFAMDTRSMVLLTYLVSRDDRLPRKAIHEFYASRRDDGLVEAHFPCPGRTVAIPTFSLFWCLMVSDHMEHVGDEALVRRYMGGVDGVLDYFDRHIDAATGLVGAFGAESWAFVDWADGWFTPGKGFLGVAVPPAYFRTGAATYHTLVYAYALAKASELCVFLGRRDTAREYLGRRDALVRAVRALCFDAEMGLYLDGPGAGRGEVSQHVQIFAVLSGCAGGEDAKVLLRRAVLQCEELGLTKASFALGFYLFRAASEAGVYQECWETLIQPWKKMMVDNLTTWAESESTVRSDCHGWSAAPLWEIGTEILGVQVKSEAYLERVVRANAPRELTDEAPAAVTIAPRPQIVQGHTSASVLVGSSPARSVRLEILPESKEVRVSGQTGRTNCILEDASWTVRQKD